MDFQTRAKLADAAVWDTLVNQIGKLEDATDVEAVISGTMAAVVRMVHWTQKRPDAKVTVEAITLLAEKFASEQAEELPAHKAG